MDVENQNVETGVDAAEQAVAAVTDVATDAFEAVTSPVADAAVQVAPKPRRKQAKVATEEVVAEVKAINARRVKTERKPRGRKAATEAAAPIETKKDKPMNYDATNWMNSFGDVSALPGAEQMTNFFGEARAKGEEALQRSRAAAEDLAELTRGNVEAMMSSAKIAATGAQTLGRSMFERGKASVEEAGEVVKSLAEAKSPTEFFQLQSDLARTSFDKMVAETSRLTEEMVKLAGETVQPISSRVAVAAERLNKITA
ncbi:phasin family protein [Sphingomonas ginkgonis]|nr:phasin family protein [Sphingomonas ginkgonis]